MNHDVGHAAQILWDYMLLNQTAAPADCLLVLGSRDDRVASRAAELAAIYDYPMVVITGGIAHQNDMLATKWAAKSEADHFAAVMRRAGYDGELLLERKASNTGENARFSYDLLITQRKKPKNLLIVTKPYMERRACATFEAQWPDHEAAIGITSPRLTFDQYINDDQPFETVVNIMVGDLQRILDYPKLGYQSKQHVPTRVKNAHEALKIAGYTMHMPQAKL